jgi:hypothetical protein
VAAGDDKASGPIFTGSIAFVAMSIPSIGLLLTIYDKIAAVSYLKMRFELLIGFALTMMSMAAVVAALALARLIGANIPLSVIAVFLWPLIVLAPIVTAGIIFGYVG